jgi:hypothetical protein
MDERYSSIPETKNHIVMVGRYLSEIIMELYARAAEHDKSKMETPEVEMFDEFTPKLKGMTYGSEEYKQCLAAMAPALAHHYQKNRHHPEHYKNGISGMSLIDLIEMFCDWLAATKRHEDGDIFKSISINAKRFGYDTILASVLKNTAIALGEKEKTPEGAWG